MSNSWLYNYIQQVCTDYRDFANVELYDKRMSKIRNVEGEIRGIIQTLHINKQQTILEFGTGTGEVAIALAHRCKTSIAVDVSKVMSNYAIKKTDYKKIDTVLNFMEWKRCF